MLGHRIPLALLAATLMTGTTAGAATLTTAPLFVTAGTRVTCNISNAGKKPLRDVGFERVLGTGEVPFSGQFGTIEPGRAFGSADTDDGAVAFFCRFTFKGPRRGARAVACAENVGCVPAQ